MEKLELKHLAPYLPYGIKIYDGTYSKTVVINHMTYGQHDIGLGRLFNPCYDYRMGLPILRPLSDFCGQRIAKESMIDLSCGYEVVEEIWSLEESNDINSISYGVIDILFKNHVDVFNLIEKGLAININTLDK